MEGKLLIHLETNYLAYVKELLSATTVVVDGATSTLAGNIRPCQEMGNFMRKMPDLLSNEGVPTKAPDRGEVLVG